MRRALLTIATLCAVFAAAGTVSAETAEQIRMRELQAQIDALEQQAAAKRAVIATTHEQAESLAKAVAIIQNQIYAVQAELAATEAKIDKTEVEIVTVGEQIAQKRAEMSRKRESIGRMVFFLDRVDQDNLVASLFKYKSLSEFVSQLHDIASVQREIMAVISDIKIAKAELESEKVELEDKQVQLEELSDEAVQRAQQLAGVKGEKSRVLTATKNQEAEYQRQLAVIEEQKSAFFKELREMELKVVSGGLYVVHITAPVPPKGTKLFVRPEDNAYITQGYGCTKYARCGVSWGPYGGAPHNGVDFAAGLGTPVKAIGNGKIVSNGLNNPGWGNWVAVQHANDLVSVYAHMSSLAALRVGSEVTAGQVIGYEGRTGKVTGSHLHLTLYHDFFTYLKDDGTLSFNYFEGTLNPLDYM